VQVVGPSWRFWTGPSPASAAQWHPCCVASAGCGCCTCGSVLSSVSQDK